MTNSSESAIIYTRVSSREQAEEGYSIEAQRRHLLAHAVASNLQVVAEFNDEETAKTTGRAGFIAMMEYVRAHANVKWILVEKTDRLLRNWKDFITVDEAGVDVVFVKEGSTFGPNSHSSQRFLQSIKVGMARHYIENLSEEVKKGLHEKCRSDGAWPAKAPIGYRNCAAAYGIEPDPVAGPLVRRLFDEAAKGRKSHRDLTRFAFDLGLRTRSGQRIGKSHIAKMITNTLYAGTFTWGGITYEGKYEPLISRSLFECVQRALASRSKPKTRKFLFALSGIVRCAQCGGMLSGDRKLKKTSKTTHEFVYYACGGKNGCRTYYPERLFDAEVVSILRSLQLDDAVSRWLQAELATWYDTAAIQDDADHHRRAQRIAHLRARMRRAYEDKCDGALDEETYTAFVADWQVEIHELTLNDRSARPNVDRATFLRAAAAPLELLQAAPTLYVSQSAEEKNALCRILFSNLTVGGDKSAASLSATLHSPFDALVGNGAPSPESEDWLWREDSNLRPPD